MKRAIAWLLTLALLISAFPAAAFAAEEPSVTPDAGDVTVEGTNSFGTLLSEDITEEEAAAEEAAAVYEGGYSVTDLEIAGSTAVVTYDTLEEALLVVSLYTEDGLQMLLSANTTVTSDATEATVTFEGDMPQYFLASAYLLDVYDLSPLCAAYDTPIYTQEMQELLASTVEDYDEALVLQLDEDETTNFAVYQDTTKIIEYAEGVNTVASIDDATMTYVIENADEQFTGLAAGDIFAYAYSDSDILIARVSAITVDGTTVTITGEDLEMEEVFSHVKIEADGETADAEVDDSTLADGVTYLGLDSGTSTYSLRDSGEGTYKASLKYSFEAIKLGGDNINATLDGAIGYSVSVTLKYLITTSFQRIELRVKSGMSGEISVTGEASSKIPLGFLKIPVLAVAEIGFEPEFVVKFEGSVSLSFGYDATFAVVIEHNKQGWSKNAFYSAGDPEWEAEFSGKIFVGLSLSPVVAIAKGFIAEMKVTAELGFEASLKLSTDISSSERHDCVFCSEGDISFVISLTPSIKFLKSNKLKFSVTLLDLSYKICDIYWSTDHNEFGFSKCPHISYLITATVVDKNGNAVNGAVVTAGEEKDVTNTNGVAEIYLPLGEYIITATAGDEKAEYTVYADQAQKIKLKMGETYTASNLSGTLGSVESTDDFTVASGKCGNSANWILTSKGQLFITGTGSLYNRGWSDYCDRIITVKISNGITSIPSYAFDRCVNLTSVAIGNSVTSIGSFTFYDCSSLMSITIPDSVTSIGNDAFSYCRSLISVTIGNRVASIGESAFYYCSSLTSITIPDSVTSIGDYAFSYCRSLISVTIGNRVASIGRFTFYDCSSLMSITIPDSVTSIGDCAFYYCSSLTSVTVPDSVTSIGDCAFYDCSSLTSISIPDGVTSVGDRAFSYCRNLTSVTVSDSVTSIGNDAFSYCSSLTSISIPDSVTSIGDYAFKYCTSLTSVTIGNSVTSIAYRTFYYCSSLISVTIGNRVASIGESAFYYCSSLTSITIPDSVTSIGDYAFYYCSSLTSITIPDSVTSIGNYAFNNCHNLTSLTIPDSVTSIGDYVFSQCYRLLKIKVAEDNSNYSSDASGVLFNKNKTVLICMPGGFVGAYSVPDSVTLIGVNAFYHCRNLTSVTIPDSVTYIDSSAFEYCTGLTSVTIPDSVTSVDDDSFSQCYNLTSIHFMGGAPTFGDSVFYRVIATAYYPVGNETWTSDVMQDYGGTITWAAYTPAEEIVDSGYCGDNVSWTLAADGLLTISGTGDMDSFPTYSVAPWYAYRSCVSCIQIEQGIASIGDYAFTDCYNLISVTIPDSVTSIGNYAFNNCHNLTSLTIPDSVASIGYYVFSQCYRLLNIKVAEDNPNYSSDASGVLFNKDKTVLKCVPGGFAGAYSVPDSVGLIWGEAFKYCTNLTSVTIPDSVTYIDSSAFKYCTGLTSVTIPDSVTYIGGSAFYYCRGLTSVTIGNSVTSIGGWAFHSCYSLTSILFIGEAPAFGDYVFDSVMATAYYPAGNETWTADVMQDYGGTITWVPYTLDENGEMVTGEATVTAAAAIEEESALAEAPTLEVSDVVLTGEQTATVAGTLVVDKIGGENPGNTVNPDAVYGGDYTTEVTDSYTLKNASFTGLVPGQQYVLLAMVSTEVENPLAPDNLLYIDQAEALEDGTLSFQYVQRVSTDISYVVACGASNKDLSDAEITFPEMESDIQNQVVSPTVVYDGVTLTEGQDYVVVGTVSFTEVGTYTCYIRGIRNYTGLVECSYTVTEAPVICAGMSLSLNGAIGVNFYTILRDDIVADENTRMVFNAGGKAYEMALVDSLADTQDDGSVWYRFSCSVPAKGMSDTISAQIYSTDGAVGKVMTYSVAAYYDDICQQFNREEKPELFAMVEAMLNYGAAAQEYFDYNTENLANAEITTAVPETVDASAYAHSVTDNDNLLSYAGMSLVLESNTVLRVFFRSVSGADISGYTFTANGQTVTPVQRGNLWYIELANIAAKNLDTAYTFTAGNVTVQGSALSYVNSVLNKADALDEKLVALCKALYAYNQTANTYFNK